MFGLCSGADMDATTAGQTLYPLHRSKTIHLVCGNFLSCCNFLDFFFLDYVKALEKLWFLKWAMYTGEACSRVSQC